MARSECNYFKPDEFCREGETGIEPFSQYQSVIERTTDKEDRTLNYLSRLPRVPRE